jgi:hypothetical protein
MKKASEELTIRGDKWRSTYKAQVTSIVGGNAPPVSSRGRSFYNRDRWTLRVLTTELCKWAFDNQGSQLTADVLKSLVYKANAHREPHREIVIARTPERLDGRTAHALVGGADHEAFHTVYSCRRNITFREVRWVLGKWAQVPDWSQFHKLLQTWSNVVEDIRIERLGRVEFPGTELKLHDLQDFILKQELEGEAAARAHGHGVPPLSTVMATFRDVGLGYITPMQEAALDRYRQHNPKAVELVLDGPLSDLLRESIALTAKQDVECLRIAFDVIIKLYEESNEQDDERQDGDDSDDSQQGGITKCPSCGAKGSKLIVRPKKNAVGQKIPNKGICTCTVCGWQEEVDVPDPKPSKGDDKDKQPSEDETPQFQGFDQPDTDGDAGGEDGDEDNKDDDQSGAGQSSKSDKGDEEGDEEAGGTGGGSSDDTSDDEDADDADGDQSGSGGSDDEGDETDESSDADDAEGEGDESADGDDADDGDEEADKSKGDKGDEDDTDNHSQDAGGHVDPTEGHEGNDFSGLADSLLEGANDDLGLKDNNSALESAVNAAQDKDDDRAKVEQNEALYRPLDSGLDDVVMVGPSVRGKTHDAAKAKELLESVKSECSYLRARLRNIVRALEMVSTVHGLKRGRDLSERYLVDTKVTMMNGKMPKRAYWDREEQVDTSLAAAVVLDQSWSMKPMKTDATRIMCALTEPLDALGCAVQVSGFRNGRSGPNYQSLAAEDMAGVHRYHGVIHDVFKRFDEKFRAVKFRFANTRADGSTPMSDGVQFGLDSLSGRSEGHRVLFVVTDGEPDPGHKPVIRRQLRLAKESGIHVIGVGIGTEGKGVTKLYPDHVWSRSVKDIPKMLIAKLNELVDAKMASKRGQRMKKTG